MSITEMILKRALIAGILLACPILPFNANAQPASTKATVNAPRHAEWTRLLQAYVQPTSDGINLFDYSALKANANDRAALEAYIEYVSSDLSEDFTPSERFAALANLYNALTVRLIVENYPVSSIRNIKPNLFSTGPWKQDIITLHDERVSLDDIEHKMLRQEFDDPRVHYAVNCASIGCPNLRSSAWEAATLNEELDAAARDYINHPRGVSVRKDGRLAVSSIYKWFREDFGGNEKGVIDHLLRYAAPDLRKQIETNPDIASYDYDWSLNDTEQETPE